ncbi:MAG: hypothetical protein ACE5Q3_12010 [Alphaproteobacteria bacterium]
MRETARLLGTTSQAVSYLLGSVVIALALASFSTSLSVSDIAVFTWDVLGVTFTALMGGLLLICFFCWIRLSRAATENEAHPWYAAGIQASNGVATLALTYTLLGISLGIGGLADTTLSPETIQEVIRGLTKNFSMAFMTTVVGLPASALLRGLMVVTKARRERRARDAAGDAGPVPAWHTGSLP